MIELDRRVEVTNRDNGIVGYDIPDLGNLHRSYMPRETKVVTFEELQKLSYVEGGEYILRNCLVIKDKEVIEELCPGVEPEYFYTEKDIIDLMQTGSLDAFLDCLDFAPSGVLETIKALAVSLPLNDVAKRKAILDKLGFDVTNAISIEESSKDEDAEEAPVVKRRRVIKEGKSAAATQTKPVRRVVK